MNAGEYNYIKPATESTRMKNNCYTVFAICPVFFRARDNAEKKSGEHAQNIHASNPGRGDHEKPPSIDAVVETAGLQTMMTIQTKRPVAVAGRFV